MKKGYLYAGSWLNETGLSGGGIHLFLQDRSGTLKLIDHYREDIAAGYICISSDRKYLYVVDEIKRKPGTVETEGSIYAFQIDQQDGSLTEMNHIATCGVFPNYLVLSPDNRTLFGINYGSEDIVIRSKCNKNGTYSLEHVYEESSIFSVSVHSDGSLGSIKDMKVVTGEPSRYFEWFQASPHPHCIGIDPAGRMLLVADRGCDQIITCNCAEENGTMNHYHRYQTAHGIGPRNCVFHPYLPYVYVVGEVQAYVLCYRYDAKTAELELIDQYLTVNKAFIYNKKNPFFDCAHPSDIRIHPNGKILYVANRGPNTISIFTIDAKDGKLKLIQEISAKGEMPWSFAIDSEGHYMYVGNKDSNNITIFRLDKYGIPEFKSEMSNISRLVCLKFLEID